MKQKTKKILSTLSVLIIMLPITLNAQTDDIGYSIKNRWTLKASYASYTTAFHGSNSLGDFITVAPDAIFTESRRKMTNFKIETGYGINKFIEVGAHVGFQHYEWMTGYVEEEYIAFSDINKSFAPLFGVNLNFHILPFLVSANECKWDLYLTAKYGGCYLPNREVEFIENTSSKYRHEYGLGIGVGYYIKNIMGFFAEYSVGQFDYFNYGTSEVIEFADPFMPKTYYLTDSPFRFRIGINAKF
ncbi:outer membrane beta-barrel protein [Odoribacter sp. OttesenSCG-928-L07]|nr:outer membrane beta-barrel protein [Odoribacter sp. OttesenSCG-928-L07]MDL2239479.1 outer membrane beta-barrel protein [Bacteroidales bacterium OttesenSCG-928-L14]MDL2240698.1 outer membrane beta-barrel protein [Bacteroidales bacterium OttesenSCG-928-K22]